MKLFRPNIHRRRNNSSGLLKNQPVDNRVKSRTVKRSTPRKSLFSTFSNRLSLSRMGMKKRALPKISRNQPRKRAFSLGYKYLIFFLALLALAGLLYWLIQQPYFKIQEISIEKLSTTNSVVFVTDQMIQEETKNWVNSSVFTFSRKDELKKIKDKYLPLEEVHIQVKFPNKVRITYKERLQKAMLKTKNDSLFLDEQGFLFASHEVVPNLPILEDSQNDWFVGSTLELQKFQFAISSVLSFNRLQLTPRNYVFEGNHDLKVVTQEGYTILFDTNKNFDLQFATLEVLLQDLKTTGKNYKQIDLRFDRPYVRE